MAGFYRKAIQAEFYPDDQLAVFGFQGRISYITTEKYRAMGSGTRRGLRLWLGFLSLLCLMLAAGMVYAIVTTPFKYWYSMLIELLLAWFFVYEFCLFSGFLRWTGRQKRKS